MARDRRLGGSGVTRRFAEQAEDQARIAQARRDRAGVGTRPERPRINQGRGIGSVVGPASGSRGYARGGRIAPFSAPPVMGGFSNPNLYAPPAPQDAMTPQGGPQPSRGARGAGGSSAVALPPTVSAATLPSGPPLPPEPAPIPELEEARRRVGDIPGVQFGESPTAPGFDVNSPLAASGSFRFSDEPEANAISYARMRSPEGAIAEGIIAPPTVTPEPDKFVKGQRFRDPQQQRQYDLALDALDLEMQKEEPDQARVTRIQSEIDRMLTEAGLDLSSPGAAPPTADEQYPWYDPRRYLSGGGDQPQQAPQQQGQPQTSGTQPPPAPQEAPQAAGAEAAGTPQTAAGLAIAEAPPDVQQEIARLKLAGKQIGRDRETGEYFAGDIGPNGELINVQPIGQQQALPNPELGPPPDIRFGSPEFAEAVAQRLPESEPDLNFGPAPLTQFFNDFSMLPANVLPDPSRFGLPSVSRNSPNAIRIREQAARNRQGSANQRAIEEALRRRRAPR